jgi:hypothetical protein
MTYRRIYTKYYFASQKVGISHPLMVPHCLSIRNSIRAPVSVSLFLNDNSKLFPNDYNKIDVTKSFTFSGEFQFSAVGHFGCGRGSLPEV